MVIKKVVDVYLNNFFTISGEIESCGSGKESHSLTAPLVLPFQEWVWPVGFFLRAKLTMACRLEAARPGIVQQTITALKCVLSLHNVAVQASDWRSLPELTNKDGAVSSL